jgi:hypothetical protein
MNIPRWLQPWHFLAISGALLMYNAVRQMSSSNSQGFSGPAEDFAPLERETTCDPTAKPGVVAFMKHVLARFGGTNLGIIRECGGSTSGHTAGMAWDWGVLSGNAQVPEMLEWLFANDAEILRRAGIMYVIYDRRIWNTRDRVWQNYTGKSPHTDHVHISFGRAGAMGQTSFYQVA